MAIQTFKTWSKLTKQPTISSTPSQKQKIKDIYTKATSLPQILTANQMKLSTTFNIQFPSIWSTIKLARGQEKTKTSFEGTFKISSTTTEWNAQNVGKKLKRTSSIHLPLCRGSADSYQKSGCQVVRNFATMVFCGVDRLPQQIPAHNMPLFRTPRNHVERIQR